MTEINVNICWQLKAPTRTWKCTRCIMQMSYLYASDFPFTNFRKPVAQHAETIRENIWEKSNDEYLLSIRVQTTINHISICFLPQYQRQRKCFLFRARAEKGIAQHIDASSVVCLGHSNFDWHFDWFVLSMRMQVILDSLFTRPGSAPNLWKHRFRASNHLRGN